MEISRRLRSESSRRTPRHRRDAHRSTDRESLFSAVEKDDEQSVAKLLKRVDVDARDENDYTALLLAAETGATKSVGTLLKAGADRDARDSYGRSAVYAAAVGGKDAAVEKLLEAGASPTNADRDGRGPFWAACATRDTKIAARLLQAGRLEERSVVGDAEVRPEPDARDRSCALHGDGAPQEARAAARPLAALGGGADGAVRRALGGGFAPVRSRSPANA